MSTWKSSLLIIILFALLITACAPLTPQPTPTSPSPSDEIIPVRSDKPYRSPANVPETDLQTLIEGNTAFALDLYQHLRDEAGNLFYSPYSITLALAMTYAGAAGQTAEAMAQTLHFTLPPEQLHSALNALNQRLTTPPTPPNPEEPPFELHIANALWGQKDEPFRSAFLDLLAENYNAGLQTLDFTANPEGARQRINAWVAEQTRDKIRDLLQKGDITPQTRLVLTNAIYFKAAWRYPFKPEETQEGEFTLLNGQKVRVPMMHLNKELAYAEGKGYQAAALPYAGGDYEMVLIVPTTGQFKAFEQALTPSYLNEILARLEPTQLDLSMPRFTYDARLSLRTTLKDMGMKIAFDPEQADFTAMSEYPGLYIGNVVHKGFVAVDEAGTEAAAATAVIMERTSMPARSATLRVDRPFIFLIRDHQSGSILFIGRVLQP
ncbi:serpin family protein [Thermanaerothrix sp. 4228-RoL]|uniref:Serpin family protein n=1 Tax=Thermanaerothrix solaris TaxID=3058434 RepID=A0ABU3NQ09_9CHLR|nr:serpin family protein [Thermanaerothrix sp. 4228-RoL]MDT8898935.1 serpin family protein [Thermanaerothrix sp. 4228-RoL]